MARIKVEQRLVTYVDGIYHRVLPKPHSFRKRITIEVNDEHYSAGDRQYLYDAFFVSIGQKDRIGRTPDEIRQEYFLELVFHLIS